MVDSVKALHALVVLVVIGVYTVMLMRGLNSQLTKHVFSSLKSDMDNNPHMKKDYEEFKKQLLEEQEQKRQIQEMEEQVRKMQEQLTRLAKPVHPPAKYVHLEGLDHVNTNEAHETTNHTRGGVGAREEL